MSEIWAFPTDTVYGIGTYYLNQNEIKKIYNLKNRPSNSPLAILCADIDQALSFFDEPNAKVKKIANHFWPGAITIVYKKSANIPEFVNSGLDTIGIRVPNNEIALRVIKNNGPMATTSVNKSGNPPAITLEEVKSIIEGLEINIIDEKSVSSNVSSTVILVAGEDIKILREGVISLADIEDVL